MNENDAYELGWDQYEVQSAANYTPPADWVAKSVEVEVSSREPYGPNTIRAMKVYVPPGIASDCELLNPFLAAFATALRTSEDNRPEDDRPGALSLDEDITNIPNA